MTQDAHYQFHPSQIEAASWILRDALGASADDRVVVLHDDATTALAHCIHQAGQQMRAKMSVLFVTTAQQRELSVNATAALPQKIRDRLAQSRRLILLQDWNQDTTHFRMLVLRWIDQDAGRIAASMPGITLEMLTSVCGGDLEELERRCRLLADRLIWSSMATIYTEAQGFAKATLNIPIGTYSPLTSSGRIRRSWGNVPSGETFVVPNVGEAEGRVLINGSLPKCPLMHSNALPLVICKGRALPANTDTLSEDILRAYHNCLFNKDQTEAATHCAVLSELGIGTNSRIQTLTGNPILDEKSLGTVHLGFGNSKQFDGPTTCRMHNDFVILRPTMFLDHTCVIESGTFVLRHEDAFPHWSTVPIRSIASNSLVRRTGNTLALSDEPRALREWVSKRCKDIASEFTSTSVGDEETSRLAWQLIGLIEDQPDKASTVNSLYNISPTMFPKQCVPHVVELLLRFRLLEIVT